MKNQPYVKILQTNSEGKQEVINQITKDKPYLNQFINRHYKYIHEKYEVLNDGSYLKKHGNNRLNELTGRTKRF